jgi:hypothetical protein
VERKKPGRKADAASKPRIAWPRWTGFRGMTLREWLQLLIVPFALVGISLLFTMQQDARQRQIEDQRAQAERALAEQRAQDATLQAYLDQMSTLMLNRNLLESEPSDPTFTLAQARTSTVILRLDGAHNRSVTRFLRDSGLADDLLLSGIDLEGADLSEAQLAYANLSETQLAHADLSEAELFNADLSGTQLAHADLDDTDLDGADLRGANLNGADLGDADLLSADLSTAQVTQEQLDKAESLKGATMPDGQMLRSDDNPNGPTFEDWLNSKGSGEDGENTDPQ